MTNWRNGQQATYLLPLGIFRQQSYPQGRAFEQSILLSQDHEVAWGGLAVAEGAYSHGVAASLQVEGAVEDDPEFEWAAEEVAQQFQIADLGQPLPAGSFQC